MTNQEIGNIGENAAANLLIEKGYKILERNYRTSHLEVDIIALKDDVVAFVEVKTRAVNYMVSPQDAVNYRKQNYIAVRIGSRLIRTLNANWSQTKTR